MYIPPIFTENNIDNITDFIAANPLATLVAQTSDGIEACHIPLFWHKEDVSSDNQHGCLYGHFARKNPIYQNALPLASWLIIFQDSGHYISPNWYPTKAITHKEVPTWNYQSIHIYAHMELIEDTDKLKWILETMTVQQEAISDNPWSLNDAPTTYIDAMCRGIIGFKLTINSIQAQYKLSQNKTAENITGVIDGLEKLNTDHAMTMAVKVANHNKP